MRMNNKKYNSPLLDTTSKLKEKYLNQKKEISENGAIEVAVIPEKCPNCGAPLPKEESDLLHDRIVTCPYCLSKFEEKTEFTKNQAARYFISNLSKSRKETQEQSKKMIPYLLGINAIIWGSVSFFLWIDSYFPSLNFLVLPIILIVGIPASIKLYRHYQNNKK